MHGQALFFCCVTRIFPPRLCVAGLTVKQAEQDSLTEAEARRRAHTIEKSVTPAPDGSVSMPVCLLDVLLFPNQPVTLFLFEPR